MPSQPRIATTMTRDTLFAPLPLTDAITLRNRVVMAPMTTWAGNSDGTVSDGGFVVPAIPYQRINPRYYRQRVVIVVGKNSACEAALELYRAGAHVTRVHPTRLLPELAVAALIFAIATEMVNDNTSVPEHWRWPRTTWTRATLSYPSWRA